MFSYLFIYIFLFIYIINILYLFIHLAILYFFNNWLRVQTGSQNSGFSPVFLNEGVMCCDVVVRHYWAKIRSMLRHIF